jgi:Acyl carrier protein
MTSYMLEAGADIPDTVLIDAIRDCISNVSTKAEAAKIDARQSLIESGILDSMGLMSLLNYIESQFGVAVDVEDLTPENFATLTSIAHFIRSKHPQS